MTGPYRDLLIDTSESFEDGNYFVVTVTDLDPNKTYPFQFRWKYKDGTFGDWSAVKSYTTPGESQPNTPSFISSDFDVSEPEKIIITYRGVSDDLTPVAITDIDRVDIYINGAPFDGSKPTDSFKEAGTKIIPAPAGTYQIVLYAISKLGTKSPVSDAVTKTVIAATTPIDPPTLPSGLSVATAPFAVSVNWSGSYSGSNFDGFKSIDIHVRGSDVGSTATSGFSTTTQVATLTVNSTTNRQNIGLDNLRQALSLANNQAAYTSPMFFYYIARNANDELYSVSGTPTYTRINSTTVNPTQANFVDLASGVISIENLVAGNGTFSSWMRVGSAGGTRIELSGVNDFSNGGNTVQKGLVAYSSGSTEILNLDIDAGTLVINGSGTFTGDLTAGSGSSIFKSDSSGIYLGNAVYASAPFSVSRSGVIKAESGTIGGWTLGTTYLQGNNIKLDTSQIIVGSTAQPYFDISPTALTHRNANGTASGKFTLTLGNSSQLTMDGTLTLNGSSLATDAELSSGLSGKINSGGAANDIVSNSTTITGGNISTGNIRSTGYSYSSGNFSSAGMEINLDNGRVRAPQFGIDTSGNAYFKGNITGSSGTFGGITLNSSGISSTGETGIINFNFSGATSGYLKTLGSGALELASPYSSGQAYLRLWGFTSTPAIDLISSGLGTITIEGASALYLRTGSSGTIYVDQGNGIDSTRNLTVRGQTTTLGHIYLPSPNIGTGGGIARINLSSSPAGRLLSETGSSQRYKNNIVDIIDVEDLNPYNLLSVPVKAFKFNSNYISEDDERYDKFVPGFIAEEVDQHYPIAVDHSGGVAERWNPSFIIPGMLALIQNLNQELINIKSRLDALEG